MFDEMIVGMQTFNSYWVQYLVASDGAGIIQIFDSLEDNESSRKFRYPQGMWVPAMMLEKYGGGVQVVPLLEDITELEARLL